ncbi:Lrp/AsnC family transcriptional regulator [Nonomuraea helvata]|uniref:Lrp/AsnC family transcriptional regulator n=1 Tax=Nonomuraea helvata TaxID=37484 RepID=A0ABV5SJL3_9ACTN
MDAADRTILRQLTSNGRTSLEVLARATNLAPSSVKRRMDRLERSGVIRGYTVLLAPDAFGNRLEVLMEITAVEGTQRGPLTDALAAQPEIVRAWTVTGDADALALVRVSDVSHLEQVIVRLQQTGSVARTRTQLLLTELINRGD